MLQAGIMVGTMLASHSKLQEKGAGPKEFDLARWKESLSDETRVQLKNDPELFARFAEMPSRIRELLTHCSDYCLPTKVTKGQADKVLGLLEKHKLTPSDERALKAYFYDNRETLGDAINKSTGQEAEGPARLCRVAGRSGRRRAAGLQEASKRQGPSSAG